MSGGSRCSVDLYWLPLGARGHFLCIGGKLFEAVAARLEHREARDIYHSVLEVRVPEGRLVIEMGPVADSDGAGRGVVAEGSVGARWAGRLRMLRYEVRCWRGGVTAYNYAVESPRRLTDDEARARRVLGLVPYVPTLVWGRDELRAGEMWCCNSLTSWLLSASGLSVEWIQPPLGGRAPGWKAGNVAAHRRSVSRSAEAARVGIRNSGRLGSRHDRDGRSRPSCRGRSRTRPR
jgi:hypothetical protein